MKAARPETDGSLEGAARASRAPGEAVGSGLGGGPPEAASAAFVAQTRAPTPTHPAEELLTVATAEQPARGAAPARGAWSSHRRARPRAWPSVEEPGTPPPAAPVADGPQDVEAFDALWPAVVELVGAENKLLSAVLAERAAGGVERRGADGGVPRDGVVLEEEGRGRRPPRDGDRGAAPADRAAAAACGLRAARGAAPAGGGAGQERRRAARRSGWRASRTSSTRRSSTWSSPTRRRSSGRARRYGESD